MQFTESHEWIERDADKARLGITQYAQRELGEIVFVELPEIGQIITPEKPVVVLESNKAAVDIHSPISGIIMEVNTALKKQPELINDSPEQHGWLCVIKITQPSELDTLLDRTAYETMIISSA